MSGSHNFRQSTYPSTFSGIVQGSQFQDGCDVELRREISARVARTSGIGYVRENTYVPFAPFSFSDPVSAEQKAHFEDRFSLLRGWEDNYFVDSVPFAINGKAAVVAIGCPKVGLDPDGQQTRFDTRKFFWKWLYDRKTKEFQILMLDQNSGQERKTFGLWQMDSNGKLEYDLGVKVNALNFLEYKQLE